MTLDDLAGPDRAFVLRFAEATGLRPEGTVPLLLQRGSRVEGGRFVRLVLPRSRIDASVLDLDLRGLSAVQEVVLSDYQNPGLRTVDLRGLRQLATFVCEGGADLLDVRSEGNEALTRLEISSSPQLSRLPDLPSLRHLRVWRCPGLAVDPAAMPGLVTLIAERVPAELDLRSHGDLDHVEIVGGGLSKLRLPASVRYVDLRENALTELDVGHCSRLRKLGVDGNPIERLDTTGCPELVSIYASRTSLGQLAPTRNPALRRLVAPGARLSSLDTSGNPHLAYLDVRQNALEHLVLPDSGHLVVLLVSGNTLRSLSLEGQTGLQVLSCETNPLESLDLRPCWRLGRVGLGERVPDLQATDEQKLRCASLRKRYRHGSGKRAAATMNRYELHDWSARFNWDDDLRHLFTAIRRPDCDLATALRIYWMGKPYWYCRWRDLDHHRREDKTGHQVHALLAEIERRVGEGDYQARIPFDPANDEGEDWTSIRYDEQPKVREPPAFMFEPTVQGPGVRAVGFVPSTLN